MVTSVTSPATASRRLNASPLQRISEVVLIGGTVGAAAAASGPLWVVRLGVAAAIAAALMACAFAWRELNAARHAHAQAIIKATREHGVALTEERTRNASVVDILRLRISDARKVIERQRLRIAGQRLQIAELKADQNYLKGEIAYRDEVINALRGAVREQEAELIAKSVDADAEVHHMPRRVFVAQDFVWQELSAEDEINDEALEALIDPKIISMGLPNYEADRQPA
jgi:hypothetical protein